MRKRASLVIVGAGIVGATAAWHLARRGWTDIVVLEQGPFPKTGGSSSHAPGIVFQTSGSKILTTFAKETVAHLAATDLDGQPCWYGVGSLEVAETPARMEDLKRKLGWAHSWGVAGAALLTPEQAVEKMPWIDPSVILGAYWVPGDGVAKPVRAVEAMIRDCGAAVEVHDRCPVIGIEQANGRVTGVVTPRGTIATDRVLVCAGIWGPKIGRFAGVPVPLMPVEHQFVWTAPMPEFANADREALWPVLRHQDRDLYFRHRDDHFAVGSYQHEPVLVDAAEIRAHGEPDDMPASNAFNRETFAQAWEDARRLLPFLEAAEERESLNGMFSFTPDGMPLLGESAHLRGFWSAMAIWITHSAGAARAVAEWLTEGRPAEDMRDCDINRFEPHAMTRSYIRARGAQQYREVYDVIHPLQPMEEPRPLRTTPFHQQQRELGAVFFESRGWELARWYGANSQLLERFPVAERPGWSGRFWSPISGAEHQATRDGVAMFDMSALPKFEVAGAGAAAFLEQMCSAKVARKVGSVTYALLLDQRGTIRSDVTVARLSEDRFQIGANGVLDVAWLRHFAASDPTVQVRDITSALCCIGIWGPEARRVVERTSMDGWSDAAFPYYTARQREIGEVPVTAMRVSYVGELGWELYCAPEYGARLWSLLWDAGQESGVIAGGRAAFDTLRLEKGYRLWGVDMDTERTPHEAGLAWAVKPAKGDFIGREAFLQMAEREPDVRLACLALDDPTIVLMGKEPVFVDGDAVGYVTSAGYGFSVGQSLAYAYLPAAAAVRRTSVDVEFFGKRYSAAAQDEPRYDPAGTRLRG
jgi:glycine cleavage system aminomethyltransferase T/glycine/D-amino acid oxidase-like deaminating enzyme